MSNPVILVIETEACSNVSKKDINSIDFCSTIVDPCLKSLTRNLQKYLKLQKISNKEHVTVRYSLQVHIQKIETSKGS